MTPTMPLPAVTRPLSFGMYEKSCVNELMLRSDGTVPLGEFDDVPPPPPQAIATIPSTPSVGISLANLIGSLSYLSHLLPSSRTAPGRECAGEQALLRNPMAGPPANPEHVLRPHVCQERDRATHTICSIS